MVSRNSCPYWSEMDFSLGRVPTLKSIAFSQGAGVHSKHVKE